INTRRTPGPSTSLWMLKLWRYTITTTSLNTPWTSALLKSVTNSGFLKEAAATTLHSTLLWGWPGSFRVLECLSLKPICRMNHACQHQLHSSFSISFH
uniref:Uncharacterized protein n=1 Tax=Oryzias melastigma TaxID=30732 RepID=A0A3B3DTY2_ORYME